MKSKRDQSPKDEEVIDILNRVVKRVEETAVDVHDLRFDLKSVKLRLGTIEHNTSVMKVDLEKLREDLEGTEERLNTRITKVGDLITISLGQKIINVEKRVSKMEKAHQAI